MITWFITKSECQSVLIDVGSPKAFYKLAFALGLEVYETEETGGNE